MYLFDKIVNRAVLSKKENEFSTIYVQKKITLT